jgi:hypothetical protein
VSRRQPAFSATFPTTDRDVGTCPDCGKLRFTSRAVAKRAARRARNRGVRVTRVYRCGGYFHWTSQDAVRTEKSRRRAHLRHAHSPQEENQ